MNFMTRRMETLRGWQVLVDDPVERYMIAFEEAKPLPASMTLNKIMHFFEDSAIPIVDDWGNSVGIVLLVDCNKEKDVYIGNLEAVAVIQKSYFKIMEAGTL